MPKFFIVSTESDFTTLKRTVTAPSRDEALKLAPTTGSYDRVVLTGIKTPPVIGETLTTCGTSAF